MNQFNYFQPTEIRFGCGRLVEVGEVTARFGKRCLVVTTPAFPALKTAVKRAAKSLKDAGVSVAYFDGVVPNPTTDSITRGAKAARKAKSDVILGIGGGSSMDTAKAIAVEASHSGTSWDYRWCSKTQPTASTLPVIAVTTTSGTGSQVTQVAVITNTAKRDKSAICNSAVYPKAAIVDPELVASTPEHVTASTGFDALTHAFEALLHPSCSPYVQMLGEEAIRLVVNNLPSAVRNGHNLGARISMAWADTLAGLCIANAGVTLPHGMGMAIGGMYPQISHGEALAITYPRFADFTWRTAVPRFAALSRVLNPNLVRTSDTDAAGKCAAEIDRFLTRIGMRVHLSDFDVPRDELPALIDQCLILPD
ncbi:MAG: iron-containing alcohol dehydrogenase, partial [bacterium]